MEHELYTNEDTDRPEIICDRNGDVVLSLCKHCGRAENQLHEPCDAEISLYDLSTRKPPTAPQLLDAAASHMRDRAATYDKPEGERSMAATVAAFNAQTGRDLTEAEGWLLMVNLKIVRDCQRAPHRDSLEDLVAYSALMAEARLK